MTSASKANHLLDWSLLALLLAGLLLPWLVAPNAAMTLNVWDLAEWASLYPPQAGTSPPLLASLLLRLHVALLCVFAALLADAGKSRWLALLAVILLVVAQLPPVEFVLDTGNLNYRQQFGLAAASLIMGLACLRWTTGRWRRGLRAALAVCGIVFAWQGAAQGLDVYGQLASGGDIGLGAWIAGIAYALMAARAAFSGAVNVRALASRRVAARTPAA